MQTSSDSTLTETIRHGDRMLALILRNGPVPGGVTFLTPGDFAQQIGVMKHPAGREIKPHVHNPVRRELDGTSEVLFIRKGRLRVDFYDDQRNYLESRVLNPLDTILLVNGGHGFEALEELEMVEVKQGPYVGEQDKIRFERPAFAPRYSGENK